MCSCIKSMPDAVLIDRVLRNRASVKSHVSLVQLRMKVIIIARKLHDNCLHQSSSM